MPPPASSPATFYGYPVELVARWCAVSLSTARLYKSGKRKPSLQALRLFTLHRDDLVLTSQWRGWKIGCDSIVDPEGNATTRGQLRGYSLILQWVSAVAARDPDTQRQYFELLKRA
jgi:hypothetical protein